ncbi:MAG: M23 family metallopeptidase [Chloroflexi bacterium]|nr:M23 family metallopeptidase [Chloroflexota bacterium]
MATEPVSATGNYRLPFEAGGSVTLTYGNHQGTHAGEAAWAFDFPRWYGAPIHAARSGFARMIVESNPNAGCWDPNAQPNYIVVDHLDGTAALYLHLSPNGALVDTNAFVRQGELIGYVGSSGYGCGPHLHFQVQAYTPGDPFTQSLPAIFADVSDVGNLGVPQGGQQANSRNEGIGAATAWYFSEGYTGSGFDQFITIFNPNSSSVSVTATYYLGSTPSNPNPAPITKSFGVNGNGRFTVVVHDPALGVGPNWAVSARLVSTLPIVIERPMYFVYSGSIPGGADGGHNSFGTTPKHYTGEFVWWLAEGWTGSGFDQYITIQNPNPVGALVDFLFFQADGQPPIIANDLVVPAQRRVTLDVRATVGSNKAVSVKITSTQMVNIERPMYFQYSGDTIGVTGAHNVVGAPHLDYTWHFAEGNTRYGFDQYLSIMNPGNEGPNNPNNRPVRVRITFMFSDGTTPYSNVWVIQAKQRFTLKPRDIPEIGWNRDFSTKVESIRDNESAAPSFTNGPFPILAERPIYFTYGTGGWTDGTVVIGSPKPDYRFYFAEGCICGSFDEFLTISNYSDTWTWVTREYRFANGTYIKRQQWISPSSRSTFNVRDDVYPSTGELSIRVTAEGAPIVAERPMYFNYYSARTGWVDGGHIALGFAPGIEPGPWPNIP